MRGHVRTLPAPAATQHPELAGANDHLINVVSDLCRGTWFRLDRLSTLTFTRRGSRPGDPLADILFSFTLSAYVQSCDHAIVAAAVETSLPVLSTPSLAMHARPATPALWCHVRLASHKSAWNTGPRLGWNLTSVATKLLLCSPVPLPRLDCLAACGKSFLRRFRSMIAWRRSCISYLWSRRTCTWALFCPLSGVGSPKGSGHGVYQGSGFSLPLRRRLLRSLAVSRFVFGSAVLNLHAAMHRRSWCRTYVDLWRRLLRRVPPGTDGEHRQAHSYAALGHAEVCSPLLALALSRATFLQRLYVHGPPEALHLLQAHWEARASTSWLGQVEKDIALVSRYCSSAGLLRQTASTLRSLCDALASDDGWWVRVTRAACKVSIADYRRWYETAPEAQALAADLPVEAMPRPHVCADCGAACGAAFVLRSTWRFTAPGLPCALVCSYGDVLVAFGFSTPSRASNSTLRSSLHVFHVQPSLWHR